MSDEVGELAHVAAGTAIGDYSMQRMRLAMGTFCVVAINGPQPILEAAIADAFAAVVTIEQLMHPTRSGSDLQRLNDSCGKVVSVHAHTWRVLELSQQLHRLSHGGFDPCLPARAGRFSDVVLREDNQVVCRAPVSIDLGGIAKGYAVDCAVDALRDRGCDAGIVNIGGDLRVFGDVVQTIVVRPTSHVEFAVNLSERSLAASDALSNRHPLEFRGYYRRDADEPLRHRLAVALAPSAAVADGLTKCAIACAPSLVPRIAASLDAEIVRLS